MKTRTKESSINEVVRQTTAAKPDRGESYIETKANAFAAAKTEKEKYEAEASRLNAELKKVLQTVEGEVVPVRWIDLKGRERNEFLYLQHRKGSRTFRLEDAEATLSAALKKQLLPFIQTQRVLDLEAAERLLSADVLQKISGFIDTAPETLSLCFRETRDPKSGKGK